MKKLFYILLLITGLANAQVVNIPDANFKAKLIQLGVDTNSDGEIQESEALAADGLNVSNSNISDLTGIEAFTNIQILECSGNQLTQLDVSGKTQLITLRCNNNQISNLNITNCTNLDSLDCSNNLIPFIDFTGTTDFVFFYCNNNLITDLIFTNVVYFNDMFAQSNLIVNLDLSRAIITSSSAEFSGNPIQTINLKNGFANNISNYFITSPLLDLQHICIDDNEFAAVNNYLTTYGLTGVVVNSYCSFKPGGDFNTITGTLQFDVNSNGCDVNDGGSSNVRINITDGTQSGATFSNTNGIYNFYTQVGNHELSLATENPTWFNFSPATASVAFVNNNNNTTTQNFCITPVGIHDDVEIVIVPTIPARPGFDATYKIVYKNKGNTVAAMNSGISLTFNDDLMDYLSSTQTVVAQNTGFLAFNVASLLPFESRSFEIVFTINAPTDQIPVNINDVLPFSAIINVSNNDQNITDNSFTLNQIVVGSYDPNDITCLEGDIVSPSEIGNYLHYNIRFENTGTAAAENIVVKTEINPDEFNINTLQLLNASHAVDARIRGNTIEFIFQGIFLETGGHGNVLLKVKTKPSLQTGDLVKNKANIYFDYNFPILTNDAETVFQALNNPDFETDNSIKIYPNPSNAVVNVKSNFNIKSIQLYDVQGRILQTNIIEDNTTSLDITSKAKGIYFLKVITDRGIKVEKLLKE